MGGQGFPGPGSAAALNRLPQPLHCKFDILRLQMAPALYRGLVAILREALEIFRGQPFGGRALCELLADERIVWLRSLIKYLRLLNIGSYSRAFNFSDNKKRNHSNRTSCAARHENEKSFIG
jgi:hypothetical protein